MKMLAFVTAVALLSGASITPADARGCVKGAVVGGVVGHVAGHHAALGAAAGCVVGHHEAHRQDRQVKQAQRDYSRQNQNDADHR